MNKSDYLDLLNRLNGYITTHDYLKIWNLFFILKSRHVGLTSLQEHYIIKKIRVTRFEVNKALRSGNIFVWRLPAGQIRRRFCFYTIWYIRSLHSEKERTKMKEKFLRYLKHNRKKLKNLDNKDYSYVVAYADWIDNDYLDRYLENV